MPRPCTCDRADCPHCRLYHKSPRYRALWDGQPVPPRKTATDAVRRKASADKPRIPLGQPHCPECVEQKKAEAAEVSPPAPPDASPREGPQ